MNRLLITLSLISLCFSISAQDYDDCSYGLINGVKWSDTNDGTYDIYQKGIEYTVSEVVYFENISNQGWRLPTFIELKKLVSAEFDYRYNNPYTGEVCRYRSYRSKVGSIPDNTHEYCWEEKGHSVPFSINLPATHGEMCRYYATDEFGVIQLYEFNVSYDDNITKTTSRSGYVRLVKIE